MIVIGIVGGIASGKSVVTRHLESLGAVVLDADKFGHEVLLQAEVKAEIRQNWGGNVFSPDGEIDRSKLASVVFDPDRSDQLSVLESITHPHIEERLRSGIQRIREEGNTNVLVLDAPVMVKTGWHLLCNEIIFVKADLETRWRRARDRGWTREMFDNRESMQAAIGKKRQLASIEIDNNGTIEDTTHQLNEIWKQWSRQATESSDPVESSQPTSIPESTRTSEQ